MTEKIGAELLPPIEPRREEVFLPDTFVQVSWQASETLPIDPATGQPLDPVAAWEWMKRLRLAGNQESGGEGGAGWLVPSKRWLPKNLQSPDTLDGIEPTHVGALMRDVGHGDSGEPNYVEVIDINEEKRSICYASRWAAKPDGKQPMVYTYRITIGDDAIMTEMRAANIKHPRVMEKVGASLDGKAIRILIRGLAGKISPEFAQAQQVERQQSRRRIGLATAGLAVAAWRLNKRSQA